MQRDCRLGTQPHMTRLRNWEDSAVFLIASASPCLFGLVYEYPTCPQFRSVALHRFATRHTTNKPVTSFNVRSLKPHAMHAPIGTRAGTYRSSPVAQRLRVFVNVYPTALPVHL